MRIGLRTLKTAVAASFSYLLATSLQLQYPAAAAIIAILSVNNTKRSSFKIGLLRMGSLILATVVAFLCFEIAGFNALAFGLYLLFFIPLAVRFKMSESIAVSSVIVTHYLTEKQLTADLFENGFLLMAIGVGFALLANLYMPDLLKELKQKQLEIEGQMRLVFENMSYCLLAADSGKENQTGILLEELEQMLAAGEYWAKTHVENHLLSHESYYLSYFDMRRMQTRLLHEMNALLSKGSNFKIHGKEIARLLEFTSQTLHENNDGLEISRKISAVYQDYRDRPLPKTRAEFEERAQLFQILQIFKTFIDIKIEFSQK